MDGSLRIVAFSDYRTQSIEPLERFIRKLSPAPDVLVYAGDDIKRLHDGDGINWFERLGSLARIGLCAVIGNDELPDIRKRLRGKNVYDANRAPIVFGKYAVIGMEGAPYGTRNNLNLGYVLYREQDIRTHLRTAERLVRDKQLIVVSHCPPYGVLDEAVRFGHRRIGSTALREFVKATPSVRLVICGHVHRCGGQTQRLVGSHVLNIASHDDYKAPGRVAVIDLNGSAQPKIALKELFEIRCIFDVGEIYEQRLREVGISRVEQLAEVDPERAASSLKCSVNRARRIRFAAQAIVENRSIVLSRFELPEANHVYVDIETDENQTYIWLIGVFSEREGRFQQFLAKHPKCERDALAQFVEYASQRPDTVFLSMSGSKFDARVILARLKAHQLEAAFKNQLLDLFDSIRGSVALPIATMQVKSVAEHLGYNFRHRDLTGLDVAHEYSRYLETKNRSLLKKLLEYNEDDVMSLRYIAHRLKEITGTTKATPALSPSSELTAR